jgi:hypothetical protein
MKKKIKYWQAIGAMSTLTARSIIWAIITLVATVISAFVFTVALDDPQLVIAQPVAELVAGVCAAGMPCSLPVGMAALVLVIMIFILVFLAILYDPDRYGMDDVRADMDTVIWRLEQMERRLGPPTPSPNGHKESEHEQARP